MTSDTPPDGTTASNSDQPRPGFDRVHAHATDGANPIVALLRRYLPGREAVFAVAAVATVVWRLSKLAYPYLLGVAVDAFFVGDRGLSVAGLPAAWLPATTRGQFHLVAGLFLAVTAVNVAAHVARVLAWRWLRGAVLHDLRTDAFAATQRLDLAFFEAERTGDVLSVLTEDVNRLRDLLDDGAQTLLQTAAFFVVLPLVMLALHWQLALVTLAFAPVMLGVVHGYQRLVEPRYDERRAAVGALNAHLETVVTGIETVKASTAEEREAARLDANSRDVWRADWAAAKLSAVCVPAREFVALATMLAVLCVGGWWALFGPPFGVGAPLSGGTFVTFYFYSQMFVAQSASVGDVADTYTEAKASAKRVFGLLHHPSAVDDDADAVAPDGIEGRVAFDDVTFTYPGGESPAVRGVEFAVEPGTFVGLVGPTGAGKSTVLKLLLRLYDPDAGAVAVDGVPLPDLATEALRGNVGYVSQDPFLFDGTVRENVAYGAPDADDAAVVAAAKRANAHGFVRDLPDGYDTRVGERGVKLSGGQRQRLAIARTLLADPDVLLLDEATSHVDNRTELLVQESLAELVADRTTFAVAHRLSTVRHADRLLVFDDGEIRERGTHEELLAEDGLYADLWRVHVGERRTAPTEAVATAAGED